MTEYQGEAWRKARQEELRALYRSGDDREKVRQIYRELWEDAKAEAVATGERRAMFAKNFGDREEGAPSATCEGKADGARYRCPMTSGQEETLP